jgi:hypothetical protein
MDVGQVPACAARRAAPPRRRGPAAPTAAA